MIPRGSRTDKRTQRLPRAHVNEPRLTGSRQAPELHSAVQSTAAQLRCLVRLLEHQGGDLLQPICDVVRRVPVAHLVPQLAPPGLQAPGVGLFILVLFLLAVIVNCIKEDAHKDQDIDLSNSLSHLRRFS